MPRRSSRAPAESPVEEKRMTRGRITKPSEPDEEEGEVVETPPNRPQRSRSAKGKATAAIAIDSSPASSPASSRQSTPSPAPKSRRGRGGGGSRRGRGRGRGRGAARDRGRGRGRGKRAQKDSDEEDEDEELEEELAVEMQAGEDVEEVGTPKKSPRGRGRGRGTPARRGRPGRKKKVEVEESDEEDAWEPGAPEVERKTPKKIGRPQRSSRRSLRSPQAEKDEEDDDGSPRRRSSGRAAAKAASAFIEAQASQDDGQEEKEEEEEEKGAKRSREDEEEEKPVEKKQKVSEEKEEEGMDTEEGRTKKEEDEEAKEVEKEDGKAASAADVKEDKKLQEEEKEEEAMETDEEEAKEDRKEEAAKEKEEKKETEESKMEEEKEEQKDVVEEEEVSSEEEEEETTTEDYVMVQKSDVPAADSAEVAEAASKASDPPKAAEEKKDAVGPPEDYEPPIQVEATKEPEAAKEPEGPKEQPVELPKADSASLSNAAVSNGPTSVNGQNGSNASKDPLLHREFVSNPNYQSGGDFQRHFSVVSYNILADCHAQRDYTKDSWISAEHLSLSHRHKRIMEELSYLDGDVICLQEVGPEHYEMLSCDLKKLGYEGLFIARCTDLYVEGEASFYKTDRFSLLNSKCLKLGEILQKELEASGLEISLVQALKKAVDTPAVAVLMQLQCKNSFAKLNVGNIHVMWDRFERPDLQCLQVASTIRELVAMAAGGSYVLCGDFNAWPGSPVHQLTQDGYPSDSSMAALEEVKEVMLPNGMKNSLVKLWWKGFQHTSSSLKSAYATVLGTDPLTTRTSQARRLDYVWLSAGMGLRGVLRPCLSEQQLQQLTRLPTAAIPSDHLSLKAELFL